MLLTGGIPAIRACAAACTPDITGSLDTGHIKACRDVSRAPHGFRDSIWGPGFLKMVTAGVLTQRCTACRCRATSTVHQPRPLQWRGCARAAGQDRVWKLQGTGTRLSWLSPAAPVPPPVHIGTRKRHCVAHVYMCVRACVHAFVYVCVRSSVCAWVCDCRLHVRD